MLAEIELNPIGEILSDTALGQGNLQGRLDMASESMVLRLTGLAGQSSTLGS